MALVVAAPPLVDDPWALWCIEAALHAALTGGLRVVALVLKVCAFFLGDFFSSFAEEFFLFFYEKFVKFKKNFEFYFECRPYHGPQGRRSSAKGVR